MEFDKVEKIKILEAKNIIKDFPGTRALEDVNFDLYKAEVHAIIGENGAGKSTLMKIICGDYIKSSGTIIFNGEEADIKNPSDSLNLGIRMIYQELENMQKLSVAENIFLGKLPKRKDLPFVLNSKMMLDESRKILKRLDLEINPKERLNNLSVGAQQLVEVAKTLTGDLKILIMDEPTSSLNQKETDQLFKIIEQLKKEGISIIYISHRLKEVINVSDRISVLRDGKNAGTFGREDFDEDEIIKLMIGKSLKAVVKPNYSKEKVVMSIEDLNITRKIFNFSMNLKEGEILGISGLAGSGKEELMKSFFGLWPVKIKYTKVFGKKASIKNPQDALRKGIVYLPEERKLQSLFLELPIRSNLTVLWIHRVLKKFFVSAKSEKNIVDGYISKLRIKVSNREYAVSSLSGGNQQKVIISRLLMVKPGIIILNDPTRGVDVGSKQEIHNLIFELAKSGTSIIFSSSEIPEVCNVANRVLVLSRGTLIKEFSGNEVTVDNILIAASKTDVTR
jgi:ribose transport system ATP-binding protein